MSPVPSGQSPQAKFCLECGVPFTPMHQAGPRGQSYADLQDALTESLEQQTATAEILRVIANSPTELGPVMEAVAENAARVCGAPDSSIYRLEGEHLRLVARRGSLRRTGTIGWSRSPLENARLAKDPGSRCDRRARRGALRLNATGPFERLAA